MNIQAGKKYLVKMYVGRADKMTLEEVEVMDTSGFGIRAMRCKLLKTKQSYMIHEEHFIKEILD